MREDLRKLAEKLVGEKERTVRLFGQQFYDFAADYLRSLDEGERLRKAAQAIVDDCKDPNLRRRMSLSAIELALTYALSPQEPSE